MSAPHVVGPAEPSETESATGAERPLGESSDWDDLLADVAAGPRPSDSSDPAEGRAEPSDLLPVCCLTGILGGFGSIVLFGATAAAPCLLAAAVGTVVGVVLAKA